MGLVTRLKARLFIAANSGVTKLGTVRTEWMTGEGGQKRQVESITVATEQEVAQIREKLGDWVIGSKDCRTKFRRRLFVCGLRTQLVNGVKRPVLSTDAVGKALAASVVGWNLKDRLKTIDQRVIERKDKFGHVYYDVVLEKMQPTEEQVQTIEAFMSFLADDLGNGEVEGEAISFERPGRFWSKLKGTRGGRPSETKASQNVYLVDTRRSKEQLHLKDLRIRLNAGLGEDKSRSVFMSRNRVYVASDAAITDFPKTPALAGLGIKKVNNRDLKKKNGKPFSFAEVAGGNTKSAPQKETSKVSRVGKRNQGLSEQALVKLVADTVKATLISLNIIKTEALTDVPAPDDGDDGDDGDYVDMGMTDEDMKDESAPLQDGDVTNENVEDLDPKATILKLMEGDDLPDQFWAMAFKQMFQLHRSFRQKMNPGGNGIGDPTSSTRNGCPQQGGCP